MALPSKMKGVTYRRRPFLPIMCAAFGDSSMKRFTTLIVVTSIACCSSLGAASANGIKPQHDGPKTLRRESQKFFRMGSKLMSEGRLAEGAQYLQQAIDLYPFDVECLCMLGEYFLDRGLAADAEDYFQNALSVHPDHERALYDLAVLRKKQRLYEQSANLFRRTISVAPKNYLAWYGLETSLFNLHEYRDCEQTLQEELRLNLPRDERADVLSFLSNVKEKFKHPGEQTLRESNWM